MTSQPIELDVEATGDFRWPLFVSFFMDCMDLDKKLDSAHGLWADAQGRALELGTEVKEARDHLSGVEAQLRIDLAPGVVGKSREEREKDLQARIDTNDTYKQARAVLYAAEKRYAQAELEVNLAAGAETMADRRLRWRERMVACLSTIQRQADTVNVTFPGAVFPEGSAERVIEKAAAQVADTLPDPEVSGFPEEYANGEVSVMDEPEFPDLEGVSFEDEPPWS